jgi:hypothetical protein
MTTGLVAGKHGASCSRKCWGQLGSKNDASRMTPATGTRFGITSSQLCAIIKDVREENPQKSMVQPIATTVARTAAASHSAHLHCSLSPAQRVDPLRSFFCVSFNLLLYPQQAVQQFLTTSAEGPPSCDCNKLAKAY